MIAHIVFRFDYGGLENGLVNIINGTRGAGFRHAVIALTEATDFSRRLSSDVPVYAVGKRPGKDLGAYVRLYALLRRLRPAIVHTRNFGTLDCSVVAFLASVPVRLHGEHGWDIFDPDGVNPKYRKLRLAFARFINAFVTVSDDLRSWLTDKVGLSAAKVTRICNGVDTERFRPRRSGDASPLPAHIRDEGAIIVGSVTRFSEIKDPLNLIEAFLRLRASAAGRGVRLMMIGDGPLRNEAMTRLREAGADEFAWLPGSRDDIPELLRAMDIFVLGSMREGISNTVLEAMASGLPVVATATGGNGELIDVGETGALVAPADPVALSESIAAYAADSRLRAEHAMKARERALSQFSMASMVEQYSRLYETWLMPKKA